MTARRIVFFDIDGTLVDHRHAEKLGALAFRNAHPELHGLEPETFARLWHDTTEEHIVRYFRGEIGYEEQRLERMRALFSHVGLTPSDREARSSFAIYAATYERSYRTFPDVDGCLAALAGARLGIITNGVSRPQIGKLLATGIAGHFGLVVCSDDVGTAKPARRIFEVACNRMDCRPEDAVYVGDMLETDALASADAGMRAVLVDREGSAQVQDPRVRVVRDLQELPGILDAADRASAFVA